MHGDDDANVPYSETIRLARQLRLRGVEHEQLILPDEVHSFLRQASWTRVAHATVDFLNRKIRDTASRNSPVEVGAHKYVFDLDGTKLNVFTYKPKNYDGQRMIVVMHGVLRNADEYRDHAIEMGERFGALIVAPEFDDRRFPSRRYQYGGVLDQDRNAAPESEWTYPYLAKLASFIRDMEDRPELPFTVIGHSAGGQFVVRMSAFFDPGATRLVAANPGSDLFPTHDMDFGYGFGGLPAELSDEAAVRRYLRAPLTIYLGTADNKPDDNFDSSETAMKQGAGRFQRGTACFEMAKKLAKEKWWEFNWRIVLAEGVDHDHEKMFNHENCEEALFGK